LIGISPIIQDPEDATNDLILVVTAMDLPNRIETSFVSKLENVIKSLENENYNPAVN